MKTINSHTCCFFGHRKLLNTAELERKLLTEIEKLIVNENVHIFLFGSKSQFNDLCYNVVTKLKENYPHIKRIYVRAEFPYIDDIYKNHLLEKYENTYFPEKLLNARDAAYVERNYEMIDTSNYCICFYDENYSPPKRKNQKNTLSTHQPKSGTKIAYDYAVKKNLVIKNIACL